MATTELQTECSLGERINSFLANRLDSQGRQAFVAHLGTCPHCAALLRDLREDERLARAPLTAQERSQIRAIVRQAREEITARIEQDRHDRQPSAGVSAPEFTPPRMVLLAPGIGRVLWLSVAGATVFAIVAWLLWR